MTFSTLASPGVSLQGGGGSGSGTASLPISGNGATITTSTPLINGTQTWNSGATTFTSLLLNVTDTASAAASLLMDLQVGGASRFAVAKNGATQWKASGSTEVYALARAGSAISFYSSGNVAFFDAQLAGISVRNSASIGFSPNNDVTTAGSDVLLTRRGAANLRLGAADAAAPVAQTLSVQSVVAGTTNTAGANLTITGSQGTGTGAGGSIIFQVAPAGSSGTAQNALATALTIASTTDVTFAANAVITGTFFLNTSLTGNDYFFGSNFYARLNVRLASGIPLGWSSSATAPNAVADLTLFRDAANTLALRNGGTSGTPVPQTFRVYNWGNTTDGEYTEINWFSNICYFQVTKAGTSTFRDLDIRANAINFSSGTSLTQRWQINTSGHFLANLDNTYDIGATSSGRPRNLYVASSLTVSGGGNDVAITNTGQISFASNARLKRSSTTLQVRNGGDTDFTNIQGKITTETAYTAGAPTATGYLVLYDSTGTAYRVPAVLN